MKVLQMLKIKLSKSKFVKGAIILAVGAIICKLIGAVYRVPLTNILGTEGMGIYQMIYPIFTLLLVVSSAGIPSAISRLISERVALGQTEYVKKLIKTSFILMVCVGLFFSVVLFLFSDELAHLQGNPMASSGYKAISPSVFFVAIISVLRGIFQGREMMTPTAVSQIIEQIVKLILGLGLGYLLLENGLEYGVAGALLGISIGELLSLLYLLITYRYKKMSLKIESSDNTILVPSNKAVLSEIVRVVLPITLANIFMPIALVVDSVLLVNLLTNTGLSVGEATSQYGLYSGVVNTIINMPIVVASALASVLVPTICSLLATKKVDEARSKINSAFKGIFYVAIPSFLAFLVFGGDIVNFLFPSAINSQNIDIAQLLMVVGSINVLLISLVQVTATILQCFDKLWIPAFSMFVGCLLKVGIVIVLIGNMGILAGMIASVVCYLLVAMTNLNMLEKSMTIELKFFPICLCISAIFIGLAYIIKFFIYDAIDVWGSILALALGACVYLLLLWYLHLKKHL